MKREKWAFFTDGFGLELLCHMVRCNAPALAVCQRFIAEMDGSQSPDKASSSNGLGLPNQSATLAEGKSIYTEKKHLIQGVEGHKKVNSDKRPLFRTTLRRGLRHRFFDLQSQ